MTDQLYLALISHLPNFTKCSNETFVFCQFFPFIRISFGACHFLSLFFTVVFLSLLAENHRCFVCVCHECAYNCISKQTLFNQNLIQKKKNRTRLRQIFRFHVVTSLFRMFTVAHCMFLSRFCFDGICCFIRIGRASHKNHFRYDFKCSSFSVLVFVYNQSPSYLWIFIYLFVCCCYVFFFFIKTKW